MVIKNVAPSPKIDSSNKSPPNAWQIFFEINKPKPLPFEFIAKFKASRLRKGVNIKFYSDASMPTP